jgi:hypothetical protein
MLLAVIIFTGCATARPVSDFRVIAGTWRGSNNLGSPVELIIYDDGHFDAIITTLQQTLRRKGQIRRDDQDLVGGRPIQADARREVRVEPEPGRLLLRALAAHAAARVLGQQLTYDIDSSYGQVMYYEGDGKRKLVMSGTLKVDGTKFVIEYLPSKQ